MGESRATSAAAFIGVAWQSRNIGNHELSSRSVSEMSSTQDWETPLHFKDGA